MHACMGVLFSGFPKRWFRPHNAWSVYPEWVVSLEHRSGRDETEACLSSGRNKNNEKEGKGKEKTPERKKAE